MSTPTNLELENARLRQQLILAQSAVLQYQYKEVTTSIEQLSKKGKQESTEHVCNKEDLDNLWPHPQ